MTKCSVENILIFQVFICCYVWVLNLYDWFSPKLYKAMLRSNIYESYYNTKFRWVNMGIN